jgi:hypothetical protein
MSEKAILVTHPNDRDHVYILPSKVITKTITDFRNKECFKDYAGLEGMLSWSSQVQVLGNVVFGHLTVKPTTDPTTRPLEVAILADDIPKPIIPMAFHFVIANNNIATRDNYLGEIQTNGHIYILGEENLGAGEMHFPTDTADPYVFGLIVSFWYMGSL